MLGFCSPSAHSRMGDRGVDRQFQLRVAGAEGCQGFLGTGAGKAQKGRQDERKNKFLPCTMTPTGCTGAQAGVHQGQKPKGKSINRYRQVDKEFIKGPWM